MTAPWLAPDGRPWGEPERGRGLPMAQSRHLARVACGALTTIKPGPLPGFFLARSPPPAKPK